MLALNALALLDGGHDWQDDDLIAQTVDDTFVYQGFQRGSRRWLGFVSHAIVNAGDLGHTVPLITVVKPSENVKFFSHTYELLDED